MSIDNRLILENSKALNVLYVEDDIGLRALTAHLFSNFFNLVDIAVDGEDGYQKYIEYFEKNGTYYDIVITDIQMPKMSGLDMCEKIKNICDNQSIILVTAFNEVDYLNKAIDIGANGFLSKPVTVDELKKVLYKTSKIVNERKVLQDYYKDLENS